MTDVYSNLTEQIFVERVFELMILTLTVTAASSPASTAVFLGRLVGAFCLTHFVITLVHRIVTLQ